jgi:hypothetical protein
MKPLATFHWIVQAQMIVDRNPVPPITPFEHVHRSARRKTIGRGKYSNSAATQPDNAFRPWKPDETSGIDNDTRDCGMEAVASGIDDCRQLLGRGDARSGAKQYPA